MDKEKEVIALIILYKTWQKARKRTFATMGALTHNDKRR
jgi:hypothetical protein